MLEQFIDKLIEEKGLQVEDHEVLAQLKSDLSDRAEDRINAAILAKLPPEKVEEFERLLSSDVGEGQIQEFCRANVPDLDEVIAMTLLEFRQIYLGA